MDHACAAPFHRDLVTQSRSSRVSSLLRLRPSFSPSPALFLSLPLLISTLRSKRSHPSDASAKHTPASRVVHLARLPFHRSSPPNVYFRPRRYRNKWFRDNLFLSSHISSFFSPPGTTLVHRGSLFTQSKRDGASHASYEIVDTADSCFALRSFSATMQRLLPR